MALGAHLQPVVVVEEERAEKICGRAQLLDGARNYSHEASACVDNPGGNFFLCAQVQWGRAERAVDKKELKIGDCQQLHRMLKHSHLSRTTNGTS
jgi:hypothetical protein